MKIAFLCVANSARSQMAEAPAREMYGNRAEFLSAGSQPSRVNPLAIEALGEIGIDISCRSSKSTADLDFNTISLVITLCAEEVCPLEPPGTTKKHWPFPDPANASKPVDAHLGDFRRVRDALREKLRELEPVVSGN